MAAMKSFLFMAALLVLCSIAAGQAGGTPARRRRRRSGAGKGGGGSITKKLATMKKAQIAMKKELAVMKEKVKEGYATMKMEHEWVKAEMKKLKKLVGDGEINENENDNDDENENENNENNNNNDNENNENNNNNNDNDDDDDEECGDKESCAMWKACEDKELKTMCKLTQKGKERRGMCRLHTLSGKKAKYCIPFPEKGDNDDKELTEKDKSLKACEGKHPRDLCEMTNQAGKTWEGTCRIAGGGGGGGGMDKKNLYCNIRR